MFILITFILIAGFILRLYPRTVLKNTFQSDTMFHLFYAREIRENNHKVPLYLNRYLRTNKNVYPFLYHFFISFLSEKQMLFFERINGAVFDTLNTIIGLIFLYFFADNFLDIEIDPLFPVYFAILFSFNPAFIRLGSGPRAFNGSPRILGQTLYIVHLISFYGYLNASSYSTLFLTVSIITGSLIYLSSIFGVQVLIAFAPLLIIFLNAKYLPVLAVSYLVSYIISFGRVTTVTRGALQHTINYIEKQKTFLYPGYITLKQYLTELIRQSISAAKFHPNAWNKLIKFLLNNNTYVNLIVIVFTPVLFIFPLLMGTIINHSLPPIIVFLLLWLSSAFFMFILTKHKPFLFLGEGERYLEFSILPLTILFIYVCYINDLKILLPVFCLYYIAQGIYFSYSYIKKFKSINKEFHEAPGVFKHINNMDNGRILPIPNYHGKSVLFYTKKTKVAVPYLMFDNRLYSKEKYFELFGNNFEYHHPNLNDIINKFEITYILSTPTEFAHYTTKLMTKDINVNEVLELIDFDGEFVLYKVKPR